MTLVSMTPRITTGQTVVRIGAPVLGLLFAVLADVQLAVLEGPERVVLVAVSGVCAAVCLGVTRLVRALSEAWTERIVVLLCVLPLVNIFLGAISMGVAAETALLMMAFVGIGALTVRPLQPVVLIGGSSMIWLGMSLASGIPRGQLQHDGLQLVLAAAVAGAVFRIRASASADLGRISDRLADQVLMLARAREERESALSRYRSLFEDGPIGISVVDAEGRFVEVNDAIVEQLARPREELLGRAPLEFIHPDDLAKDDVAQSELDSAAGAVARMEMRYVRPSGEVRWASISLTRLAGPHGAGSALAHVQDITERKQLELDLIRSRDSLQAAAEIAGAVHRGEDPRPIALRHLQHLTRARDVTLIERLDDSTLHISACVGTELQGIRIPLDETSVTTHVWHSGEPVFLSEAATSPLVSPRLLEKSGATSLMWHPVGDEERTAVLAVGWGDTVTEVSDLERQAVGVVAAELSSALVSEELRRQLEDRSRSDALTGLLNRRGWDAEAGALVDHSRDSGAPLVLAVVDLDHFKAFNDEFGHLEGDVLLAGFAANARAVLRDVDVFARWGGEEFTIALRGCDAERARPVLERVRSCVPSDRTCSIGFATLRVGESLADCLRRVDLALYRAKSSGRDRVEYAGDEPERAEHRLLDPA